MVETFRERIRKLIMQAATSDDVIKREVIRQVIYKEADLLSVGVQVIGVQNYEALDIKWSFPSELEGHWGIPEGSIEGISAPMSAIDFHMTLEKAEVRYQITDWAKIRQLQNFQSEFSRRRASEKLAWLKDDNILLRLYAGAGATTKTATQEWATATGTQIAGDIAGAITSIMDESNIKETEISNLAVIVPAKRWGYTLAPVELENIRQSIQSYFKAMHGIVFYPTRSTRIGNDGLVIVKGLNTAIHGVYTGGAVPLVEEKRIHGRATEYVVSQFFNTKVVPESATDATSDRICKISGVVA